MNLVKRMTENKGYGVFATATIYAGATVLLFKGNVVHRDQLPTPYTDDKYVQIEKDYFMGPSGGLDDYVNHSCDPNCKLLIGTNVLLVAVRTIVPEEEITYDYSSTIKDDDWRVECRCGASNCRGVIAERKVA